MEYKTTYDDYYQTPNYFGEPNINLIQFFSDYPIRGRLLDIGCGQGRNAIPLSRFGYKVTGIDNSQIGVEQMVQTAHNEALFLEGIVTDMYTFEGFYRFDFILLDSMLHFEKNDFNKESIFVANILQKLKKKGILCFCIQDSGKKFKNLKKLIKQCDAVYNVLKDEPYEYRFCDQETDEYFETKYRMYIIQKI